MNNLKKYSFFFFLLCNISSSLYARDFKNLYRKAQHSPRNQAATKSIQDGHYVITLKHSFDYKSFGWRMYYKGAIVPQKEGTFQFSGEKDLKTFDIVVAQIKTPDSPVIKHLEVPEGVEYKHYTLERKNSLNNTDEYRWTIHEASGNNGFKVPENALIVFLDPAYIETIETVTWKKDNALIVLPTIHLSKDPLLHEASIKSVLAALDTDPFHGKLREKRKTEESVTISRIG